MGTLSTDQAMDFAQQRIVTKGEGRIEVIDALVVVGGLDRKVAEVIYDVTLNHPVTKQLLAVRVLTTDDLDACLADDDHLGWGYAIASDLSNSKRERLDRAVVAVANELGLSKRDLFHWTNSKYGRWLVDGIYGRDESPSKASVRHYLNPEAMKVLKEGR